MMNSALIKIPTIDLWKAEFKEMFSGRKTADFERLGGAGAYVINIFSYTSKNPENLNRSVDLFFDVFNKELENLLTQQHINDLHVEIMVEIAAAFVKRFDARTLNTIYLSRITKLLNTFIQHQNQNVNQNQEEIFYTYLHYLKMFVLPIEDLNNPDFIPDTQIVQIENTPFLADAINHLLQFIVTQFNPSLSGFATFLLYLLNQFNEFLPQNKILQTELIEYSIANKAATNHLISQAILQFASEHENTFNSILESMQCRLTSDGFSIIYNDGSFKDLAPEQNQWEQLNKIYNLNKRPVHEILKEQMNRELAANQN